MTSDARTWFVTGAGRGLGRSIVQAAVARGHQVVATARDPEKLQEVFAGSGGAVAVVGLDVSEQSSIEDAKKRALDAFGSVDVVVNNAGYGLAGGVEEVSEAAVRNQMEVNFFGALWVTRAFLPEMRRAGAGHIVQISSVAGLVSSPNLGIYAASKWALEAMSESLYSEVKPFGIHVTLVEPSGMRTDWSGNSMQRADPLPEYDAVLGALRAHFAEGSTGTQPGDPDLAAGAIVDVAAMAEPPLRLLLGTAAWTLARTRLEERLRSFDGWEDVARAIDSPALG